MNDPNTQVPDYGEFAAKGVPLEDALPKVTALVKEAQEAERAILKAEEELKAAKSRYAAVVEDALPKLMESCGLKTFTTEEGLIVSVKDKIENSVPAARRGEACDWLEKNGHGDIIKRVVAVSFAINEGDVAKACAASLQKEFRRTVILDRKVEPSTLKSLLTKKIEAGESVPRDLFGVREMKHADIKVK